MASASPLAPSTAQMPIRSFLAASVSSLASCWSSRRYLRQRFVAGMLRQLGQHRQRRARPLDAVGQYRPPLFVAERGEKVARHVLDVAGKTVPALDRAGLLEGHQHVELQVRRPADLKKAGMRQQLHPLDARHVAGHLFDQPRGERRLLQVDQQPHQLAIHPVVARRILVQQLPAQRRNVVAFHFALEQRQLGDPQQAEEIVVAQVVLHQPPGARRGPRRRFPWRAWPSSAGPPSR